MCVCACVYVSCKPPLTRRYWASVTAATVGYGDITVKTVEGEWFSVVYIFVDTVTIAGVSLPTDIYLARMRRAAI